MNIKNILNVAWERLYPIVNIVGSPDGWAAFAPVPGGFVVAFHKDAPDVAFVFYKVSDIPADGYMDAYSSCLAVFDNEGSRNNMNFKIACIVAWGLSLPDHYRAYWEKVMRDASHHTKDKGVVAIVMLHSIKADGTSLALIWHFCAEMPFKIAQIPFGITDVNLGVTDARYEPRHQFRTYADALRAFRNMSK